MPLSWTTGLFSINCFLGRSFIFNFQLITFIFFYHLYIFAHINCACAIRNYNRVTYQSNFITVNFLPLLNFRKTKPRERMWLGPHQKIPRKKKSTLVAMGAMDATKHTHMTMKQASITRNLMLFFFTMNKVHHKYYPAVLSFLP